jgi:hypothetical protein
LQPRISRSDICCQLKIFNFFSRQFDRVYGSFAAQITGVFYMTAAVNKQGAKALGIVLNTDDHKRLLALQKLLTKERGGRVSYSETVRYAIRRAAQ